METPIINAKCTVWRSEGLLETTRGELLILSGGEVRFVVDGEPQWTVPATDLSWKHPWYGLKASIRILEPAPAAGLYMGYSPRPTTSVGSALAARQARSQLKVLTDRLDRLKRVE